MGIWLGPYGGRGIQEGDFTYDGEYLFTSDGKDWEMALLTGNASSLVFLKNPGKVDLTIVAGGRSGGATDPYDGVHSAYNGPSKGGDGGNGGGVVPVRGVQFSANTNYAVTVGASDSNSSVIGGGVSYTAVSGNGSSGGTGGDGTYSQGHTDATPGIDGVYAYGENSDTLMFSELEFPGHLFGPGGGGAGSMVYNNQNNNSLYALGGESNGPNHEYGKGGEYNPYQHNGKNGYANHGQGGGGAYFYWISHGGGRSASGTPGAGGSGVVFIRNAR